MSWFLYVFLVHPDSKCLLEAAFYVASNNGSVLLSCVTTLALGLIQPRNRLDYLPPRASLITSSADYPKKTKSQINVSMCQRKSLKCLTTKVWFPSSLQARNKFLSLILMFLMVLDAFLVPHTILRWFLVSYLSRPPANQSLFI